MESSKEMQEGFAYLENGFNKIDEELCELEQKIHVVTGFIFKRHKYTEQDIMDSAQMNRIKSLAGKIKDDVTRWDASGKFPYRLRILYNENAEMLQERLRMINQEIQERRPTLWERVGRFFRRLYRMVVELLPLLFQRLISGNKFKYVKST
jgi:tetrahydromethanopterin S-methyltransferase subunit G